MDNNCPALRRLAELEAMLKQATERIKELEARLKTDSSNSSKPSGSDGLGKKTHQRSLRKKSGRKPGGQKGHPGSGPEWSDNPDHAEPHALNACPNCGVDLSGVKGRVVRRRQSTDIPPPEAPKITEHQLVEKACPHCGEKCIGEFPPDIKAPTQYGPQLMARAALLNNAYQFIPLARASELMRDFFLCPMSGGTIVNAGKRLFEITEGAESVIKDQLRKVDVLNADETTMRGPGGNHHVHFAGTERLSHLGFHKSRGNDAMDEIGILPEFKGTLVTDFYPAYERYGTRHGKCGGHLLRELKAVGMLVEGQSWAMRMTDAIMAIKDAVDDAKSKGHGSLGAGELARLTRRYDDAVKSGARQNKVVLADLETGRRGAKKTKALNLLARLHLGKDRVLLFAHDFSVPFDNNLAERGVRMSKVKQKISGVFRGKDGGRIYCRIRSYVDTARKNGVNAFKAVLDAFMGKPFIPTTNTS